MGKVNWTRTLFGGLVAGLVINVFVLGSSLGAAHLALGRAPRQTIAVTALMCVLVFFVTILLTWFYAAVQSHVGSGLRGSLMVGVAAGLVLGGFQYIAWILTHRHTPAKVWAAEAVITCLALVIATVLGAWVYDGHSGSIEPHE